MPRRTIAIVLLGLLLPAVSAAAPLPAAQADRAQEGLYEGTGRACAGTLQISQKRVTWRSAFSQCSAPTDLIDHQSQGAAMRWTYRLGQPQKQCLYNVVMLERVETPGEPIGWRASGFPSVATYKTDADEGRLSCYLVKVR